ncbi:colicin E3/pyocin S6 family cytotoxin [Spirosoma luteum]|uniref:colicin E3/pyocin S6 family cytotoxin n=1 Tax=Spirosoma luteum TaxID=431553 RepID=UPI000A05E762|nr:colicin E3/pyocin S6 family cytotoxin [Spirosoma luteum]
MAGKPIPNPCFLDGCESLGAINGVKRWRNIHDDRLFTWDALHGEIEVFNKRGKHIGVMNAQGDFIKEAVKGRKIDV